MNDILAAGGTVSFGKTDGTIYATGNAAPILQKDGVDANSVKEAPDAWPVKKPRIGIYEPWGGNIDEGWTRWILEQFHFPFTRLHNADVQAGHLREQFDTIVIRRDGHAPDHGRHARRARCRGSMRAASARTGAQALRDFVTEGGTLVTLGNAALFAIEQFNLPVTNVVAGLRQDQFFCSGSLLRTEIKEPTHPVVAGLPPSPAGDVRTQSGVRHASRHSAARCWPSYVKDRNPLLSGFLLGAERIQGQGRGARRQLRQGPHHHAGLPAAVARPIARHLQVPLQRAVLQPVDGAGDAGRRRGARRQGRRNRAADGVATRSRSR